MNLRAACCLLIAFPRIEHLFEGTGCWGLSFYCKYAGPPANELFELPHASRELSWDLCSRNSLF